MSIVFILLGGLAATLFIISKLGLSNPPALKAEVSTLTPMATKPQKLKAAA